MALQATRLEFRITLSNTDRGVDLEEKLIVARHPSESQAHVTLRVLAWCLLHEERLEFGPGLSDPDVADLWTRDLTGQLTTWVECGTADAEKVRKVMLHNRGIAVHAVLSEARRRDAFVEEISNWRKSPSGGSLHLWMVDPALVEALAAREERRQTWTVTIVGGHIYLEADGTQLDGAVVEEPLVTTA